MPSQNPSDDFDVEGYLRELEQAGRAHGGLIAQTNFQIFGPRGGAGLVKGIMRGLAAGLSVMVGSKECAEFLYQLADGEVGRGMDPVEEAKIVDEIQRAIVRGSGR
jgi:hypothetical protein